MKREEEKLVHSCEQVTLLARKIRRRETFSPSRGGEVLKVPLDGARTKWRFRESFLE